MSENQPMLKRDKILLLATIGTLIVSVIVWLVGSSMGYFKPDEKSSHQEKISEASKFTMMLDKKLIAPGADTQQVFNHLYSKGLSGSFTQRYGNGNERIFSYTFSDESIIIIVAVPNEYNQGLKVKEFRSN